MERAVRGEADCACTDSRTYKALKSHVKEESHRGRHPNQKEADRTVGSTALSASEPAEEK